MGQGNRQKVQQERAEGHVNCNVFPKMRQNKQDMEDVIAPDLFMC